MAICGQEKNMNDIHMLQIDAIAQTSGLNRINAGYKVLLGLLSLAFCISSQTGISIFIVLVTMVYVTVKSAGIGWKLYIQLLKIPILFLLLSTIVVLIEVSGNKLGFFHINLGIVYLNITKESLQRAFFIAFRAFGGVSCLYMISLTTTLAEIIQVLDGLKIPDVITELMYLIFRYIVILLEIHNHMAISARSRMGYDTYKNSFRSMVNIGRSLLLIAFQKAAISFDAMTARGYYGKLRFQQDKKPLHKKECIQAMLYVSILLASFIWERKMA